MQIKHDARSYMGDVYVLVRRRDKTKTVETLNLGNERFPTSSFRAEDWERMPKVLVGFEVYDQPGVYFHV